MEQNKTIIGWREWVLLEGLCVPTWTKAKIDTGATTSSLHAYGLEIEHTDAGDVAHFVIQPTQDTDAGSIETSAPVTDHRSVRSSNGVEESRPVIETNIRLGDLKLRIELTLTDRDSMGFRMLVGRSAMRGRLLVDSGSSFLLGTPEMASE